MRVAVHEKISAEVIFSQRDDKVSALRATAGEATRQIISRVRAIAFAVRINPEN